MQVKYRFWLLWVSEMELVQGAVYCFFLFESFTQQKSCASTTEELREMSRDSKEETVSKLEMQQWEEFDNYSTSEHASVSLRFVNFTL